jgi:cell division protein FtsL
MEEVWKREQEAAKEQQRMEDLKKQIYEERAREEMNAIAEAAGVKVCVCI